MLSPREKGFTAEKSESRLQKNLETPVATRERGRHSCACYMAKRGGQKENTISECEITRRIRSLVSARVCVCRAPAATRREPLVNGKCVIEPCSTHLCIYRFPPSDRARSFSAFPLVARFLYTHWPISHDTMGRAR